MARIVRQSRRKRRKGCAIHSSLLVVAFFIAAVIVFVWKHRSRHYYPTPLASCRTAEIWSHSGHWDIEKLENNNDCDEALWALHEAGIHHFDIDVVYDDGEAVVAHPTELVEDFTDINNFVPSPCSRITLSYFLHRLDEIHGPNGYFITIEPKAAWHLEDRSKILAPPKLVMKSILDALEKSNLISPTQCGIILEEWQLDLEDFEMDRIWRLCRQTTLPFKGEMTLKQPFSLNRNYRLSMPSQELFHKHAEMFLSLSVQFGIQNVVWVVDDKAHLHDVLELPGVHGIISNRPIAMHEYYREFCGGV